MYFLGYLVVSAIQMGATIDYAIVITSRYMDLKTHRPIKEAIIESLNQAFPTIVTSGSMLVAAGFIISNVSTNAVVAAIGLALGRGTLTSIALVLFVLPQTLLIGDIIIQKTAFTLKYDLTKPLPTGGRIRMSGHIKGYVKGVIDGEFNGIIDGEMGAVVRVKDSVEQVLWEEPKSHRRDALPGEKLQGVVVRETQTKEDKESHRVVEEADFWEPEDCSAVGGTSGHQKKEDQNLAAEEAEGREGKGRKSAGRKMKHREKDGKKKTRTAAAQGEAEQEAESYED